MITSINKHIGYHVLCVKHWIGASKLILPFQNLVFNYGVILDYLDMEYLYLKAVW